MLIAVFLLLLLYFFCCRPVLTNGIKDGSYLSRERTCTINAWMVMTVFFSHAVYKGIGGSHGHVLPLGEWDAVYFKHCVRGLLQLMVSTFLLFSGYGVMESMKNKGKSYLNGFMRKRFWKVLYQFELGLLCYYLLWLCWGKSFSLTETLAGFSGFGGSFGAPTWFIVVTLFMYLVAFISFHFTGWMRWCSVWGLSILMYISLSHAMNPEHWWYDTLFCFPAGMTLACCRNKLEAAISWSRIPAPLLGILLVALAYFLPNKGLTYQPLFYNLRAILFAYGMALAWSGFRFRRSPRLMLWLGGSALFTFYFYHILVYTAVLRYVPIDMSSHEFLAISLALSLLVAWGVMKLHALLDRKVFHI